MRFAHRVFLLAGIYGILTLLPQFFMERRFNQDYPPAIAHAEFYYGFTGLAFAWQFVFFIIASDPLRYRPMMLAGVLEKTVFAAAAIPLYLLGRETPFVIVFFSCLDLALGVLFAIAWWQTRDRT